MKFQVCFTSSLTVVPTVSYYPSLQDAAEAVHHFLLLGTYDRAAVYYGPTGGVLGIWRRATRHGRNIVERINEAVAA